MVPPGAVPERRAAARVLSQQVIQLKPLPAGPSQAAVTRDASPQGVYLYTDQAFAEGQQIEIERLDLPVDNLSPDAPKKHLARVLRIDCIEPERKYGLALSLERSDAPAVTGREESVLASRRSVSLPNMLSSQTRYVKIAVAAIAVAIVAAAATTLAVRAVRYQESLVSQQRLERGEQALRAGNPHAAAEDFGAVLALAPNRIEVRLELARAFAAAGQWQDAMRSYVAVLEAQPNSGPINLELARLQAKRGESPQAVGYYRAAIAGAWASDAIRNVQRTRLELIRYLLSRGAADDARAELRAIAENPPDDMVLLRETASLLTAVNDSGHALPLYNRVLVLAPQDQSALMAAGEAAYAGGQYLAAQRLLMQLESSPEQAGQPGLTAVREKLDIIRSVLSTYPARGLPPGERADRVLRAWDTVTRRLASCAGISLGSMLYARNEVETPKVVGPLASVYSHWQDLHERLKTSQQRWALRNDPVLQAQIMGVAYEIEQQTAQSCTAPTGIDLALLRIAQHPEGVQQ